MHQSQTPRKLGEPHRRPSGPGVERLTRIGAPGPNRRKPQVFVRPGAVATAPPSYPGRPRRQGTRRAHLVRPPAGCPRRPAGARSSEPGLSASSPAAGFPPLPAPRSDSPAPAPGKVWPRLPGCSVRWRRPRGWREHAEAGAGEEPPRGPPTTSPRAPLPRPASTAAPRVHGGALRQARDQGRAWRWPSATATGTRTPGHTEPQTRLRCGGADRMLHKFNHKWRKEDTRGISFLKKV